MNNIDLSIIIVNYKSWGVLQQCLDSFNQYPPKINYEIIVVDNDSKDGELATFSEKNPSAKFVSNSGNHGFSSGCNLGVEISTGQYLLFLNPDVVLTNSPAIDKMYHFSEYNPSVGITSCRTINPKGKPEREMAFSNPWLIISWIRAVYKLANKAKILKKFPSEQMIWQPDWVAGSVILIKKELFNTAGKWNQNNFWMYYEDVELCRKIKAMGKGISLLRNVELKHAHGGSSRRNPKTTAITKSEVVTSSHVYIQLSTQGLNRLLLHCAIFLDTFLSQLIKILFTFLIFWKTPFKTNILVFIATFKYYANALVRNTWKSKRLER
ncbi:glycosyltransferase family 2 protein [Candidatus Thioglobus sp.]|uniref:glycosyltransferase family 2 protein n=1 Tax=Candidatus Thioglobus sp. TaxID=2026721 RepID=UPI003D0E0083